MPKIEHKSIPFEVKSVTNDGAGSFEGLAAASQNIDATGDIIAKGAFSADLASFLSDGFIGGLDHDWKIPIGHPHEAKEVDGGLLIKAVFDATPDAQAMRARMAIHPESGRATIKKLSIGYKTLESKQLRTEAEVKSYWNLTNHSPSSLDLERSKQGARLLTKLRLFEVSPVLIPANDRAQITGSKALGSSGFAENSRSVATALRETQDVVNAFLKRFEARALARTKDGRELSQANWTALKEIHDQHKATLAAHQAVSDQMGAILDRTAPKGKTGTPASSAEPAFDEADAYARFAQILYATNPMLLS